MVPIPSHLVGCVVPKDLADQVAVDAWIRCSCGCERFAFLYLGETQVWQGKPVACYVEKDGHYFFVIKARCAACAQEHLLYDKDFHGWLGFVCHQSKAAALPRPPLVPWTCPACGEIDHCGSIRISHSQSRWGFVADTKGRFPEDRWPDAFTGWGMDLACCRCGTELRGWVEDSAR